MHENSSGCRHKIGAGCVNDTKTIASSRVDNDFCRIICESRVEIIALVWRCSGSRCKRSGWSLLLANEGPSRVGITGVAGDDGGIIIRCEELS